MRSRTTPSALSVRLLPLALVRSLRRSSEQHSRSWDTTLMPCRSLPVLYSPHLILKYCHSSLVPDSPTDGRFNFSALCAPPVRWMVAWVVSSAARTTASSLLAW